MCSRRKKIKPDDSMSCKLPFTDYESRMNELMDCATSITTGDYSCKIPISEKPDSIDAVAKALNTLSEKLNASNTIIDNFEKRVNNILENILKLTKLDFSEKLTISDRGDEIDAISVGVNTVSEEFESTINHLKQSEEAHRQSDLNLKFALDASQIGYWDLDLITHSSHRSARYDQIFGYMSSPPEWNYKLFLCKHVHSEDRKFVNETFRQALLTGNDWYIEYRIIRTDNSIRWIWARGQIMKDNHGKNIRMIGFVQDFTKRKRAEQKIKEDEQQIESIFNNAPDAVIVIDAESKVRRWNSQAENIFGWSAKEVIGNELHEFIIPHRYREGHVRGMKHYLKTGEGAVINKTIEIEALNKEGHEFFVALSISPNLQGEKNLFIAFIRDITKQKQAEVKIKSTLIQLTEAEKLANIGSWNWNITTNKISWSDELFRIYGLQPQQFVPTLNIADKYIHPEDREFVNKVTIPAYRDKSAFKIEYRIIRLETSGEIRTIIEHCNTMTDLEGNVIKMIGTINDVTEQKLAEEKAKIEHEKAEKLIKIAQEESEKIKTMAEIAKAKEQFFASMSHEIRTPLNGIIGFTKILLRGETTETQKQQLEAIKTSSDILLVLINDILDLAKVDAGKMNIEATELNLHELINTALSTFELRFQEKELKLNKQFDNRIPNILIGDPVRIHQILLNLLNNAVKFTNNGGQIGVVVNLIKQNEESSNIEFLISDTGIGIPAEKLESIFDPFVQSGSDTTRKYGGTGLGLSIVKRLTDLMGGTVSVKSILDVGSTFNITLTLKKSKTMEINKKIETNISADELQKLGKLNVLVVEDNTINQLLMKTLLDDFGFVYAIANNGKDAIEKLKEKSYDIILMDLQMPEMNGFEATEYIRNVLKSETPIIALTADVSTLDSEKCKAFGMNDYIAKPIDEKLLLSKITALIKNKITIKETNEFGIIENKVSGYTNLEYLRQRTKSNPQLMMEMISIYLEQTSPLINALKDGLNVKNWDIIYKAAHKMIPSFSIVGISPEYENMAKKIQELAKQELEDGLRELITKLEPHLTMACKELEEEYNRLKKNSE